MRGGSRWKDPPGEDQANGGTKERAKARLVVIGYTDPDLTEIPRDSPTLAVRSRFTLFALAAMHHWHLYKVDIKTAFLQGEKSEEAI